MEGKVAEQEKSCNWPKRSSEHYLRTSRGGINQKSAVVTNICEAIARVNNNGLQGQIVCDSPESGGMTRMKILVKKEHLKQVVEAAMRSDGKSFYIVNSHSPPSSSLEQRLNLMRSRHLSRASHIKKRVGRQPNRSSWKPALHSIPEEQLN